MKYKIFLSLMFFSLVVLAQDKIVTGIVTDKKTGEPIAGASVYIDGSSIGISASSTGEFALKGFPNPPFALTISAVGYNSETIWITEHTSSKIYVRIAPKVIELPEVMIRGAVKDGWLKFGAEFTHDFIGYSAFSKQCKILNYKDLRFFFDDNGQVLRVTALKPLKIRNYALGFEITYWLDDFVKNYKESTIFYRGSGLFNDMITEKTSKKRLNGYYKNRNLAFNGSLQHFIQSIFKNSLSSEGFEVRRLQKIKVDEYYDLISGKKDTACFNNFIYDVLPSFFQNKNESTVSHDNTKFSVGYERENVNFLNRWFLDTTKLQPFTLIFGMSRTEGMKGMRIRKLKINCDTITYSQFSLDRDIRPVNGMIYFRDTTLLTIADIGIKDSNDHKILNFNNYLEVKYNNEPEEPEYAVSKTPFGYKTAKFQTSVFSILEPDGVELFENGNFQPAYGILLEGYWAFEKLDKFLPLEFRKKE